MPALWGRGEVKEALWPLWTGIIRLSRVPKSRTLLETSKGDCRTACDLPAPQLLVTAYWPASLPTCARIGPPVTCPATAAV